MHILFVGNSSYYNRGCEAIVRGTMRIVEHRFGKQLSVSAGVFADEEDVAWSNRQESDSRIRTFSLHDRPYSASWLKRKLNKKLGTSFRDQVPRVYEEAKTARWALQVGGDNYSLDYGRPERHFRLDRALWAEGMPSLLWGASVGPFSKDPQFESVAIRHLRNFHRICVREEESASYLAVHGLTNVTLVADPAFLMEPAAPENLFDASAVKGWVGVNLSPIMWRYAAGMDFDQWTAHSVSYLSLLLRKLDRLLLIPHVQAPTLGRCDWKFISLLLSRLPGGDRERVQVLPDTLNAAQLKHCISGCRAFIGARTHSTIAALSSGVPTLSIAYSTKARGINRQIYGHLENVIEIEGFTADSAAEATLRFLSQAESEKGFLRERIGAIKEMALAAGAHLPG